MDFYEVVDQIIKLLQQRGRLTYRVLKLQFKLDDETLEALKEEILYSQTQVVNDEGRGLIWTSESETKSELASPQPAQQESAPQAHPTQVEPPSIEPATSEAERRQLTVMFCDLVGSTELSGKLDPEDLREVVRAYQETAAEVIERYEGHIAQYLGDGLLIYFGYPSAHEDDAVRAVHTGLGIVDRMTTVNTQLQSNYGVQLAVRVGIHTGPVVVGKMGGGVRHEQLAVGEAPNIAARLQSLAVSNGVVISALTRRLVGGIFDLEYLGIDALKGVAASIPVYSVRGESAAESRFEAATTTGLTPLVGREEEIGLLLRRWEQAKGSEGQVVLLESDAGIGKSRLTQTLRERVTGEPHIHLRYQSSPYYSNSAFYPIITQLERAAQFTRDDSPDQKRAKLEALLAQATAQVVDVAPLFAALLTLPPGDRYPPLSLSPRRQKEQTIAALVDQLMGLARRQPVLSIWEDAHWSDPTSLEVLDLLVSRVHDVRVLVVITYRPEFKAPWKAVSHVTELPLSRLSQAQVEAMVTRLTGGKTLPREVRDQILTKTDGVPLFVEELTKTILESGLVHEAGDRYDLTGPLPQLAIPETLHDSLTARLDRLSPVKEIAQIGAVIGREFAYEVLAAVAPMHDVELEDALHQLVNAGLLFRRGQLPEAHYLFKHALVRDTAYDSLLRSTRQQMHTRIAQTLVERFAEIVAVKPEVVAHHYTEGGCAEEAVAYWQHAGQQAIARSANMEAVSHLSQGLTVLAKLPQTREQLERELDLQMALGSALVATSGYTDVRVGQAYDRSWELCQTLGNQLHDFSVLRGQQVYHVARGELVEAQPLAEAVLRIAEREEDATRLVGGHYTLGSTLLFAGELTVALPHVEQGIALYDPANDQLSTWPGSHPAVQCQFYRALILWSCGYPAQALAQSHEALQQAHRLSHSFTLAQTTCKVALLHAFRREPDAAAKLAEASIELCREHGVLFWLSFVRVVYGWALFRQGQAEQGLCEMQEGITAFRTPSQRLFAPLLLAFQAEVHLKLGQSSEAHTAISEALTIIDQNGEGWWKSELYRLKGEQLRQAVAKRQTSHIDKDVEACFHQALNTASHQEAKSLELRAATSLARLWQSQGKRQEATDLLAPVYGWFTEGFDTADLQEAKALLEELSSR